MKRPPVLLSIMLPRLPDIFGLIEATSNVGLAGACWPNAMAPMAERTAEMQMNQRARGLNITPSLIARSAASGRQRHYPNLLALFLFRRF
jgi:hypothetical protein